MLQLGPYSSLARFPATKGCRHEYGFNCVLICCTAISFKGRPSTEGGADRLFGPIIPYFDGVTGLRSCRPGSFYSLCCSRDRQVIAASPCCGCDRIVGSCYQSVTGGLPHRLGLLTAGVTGRLPYPATALGYSPRFYLQDSACPYRINRRGCCI